MALDLANLKIIKKSTTNVVDTSVNEVANVKDTKLGKLEETYKTLQKGGTTKKDFNRVLLRLYPKLLTNINPVTRTELNRKLKEISSWYINLKNVLMDYEELIVIHRTDTDKNKIAKNSFRQTLTELNVFLKTDRFDKAQSLLTKDLLAVFINDDPFKPIFNVNDRLVNFLIKTERTTSFIKEMALCFGLYRKYISKLAEDFAKDIELDKEIKFKNIDDVQPRFNLINDHILKSNPKDKNKLSLNLEILLNKEEQDNINKDLKETATVSGMGLKKRLNEINKWLNDGLFHTQYLYNRLNNLKVKITDKNSLKEFEPTINDNYMVWGLLKDIEIFLGSMEDLLLGKSFLVGVNTIEKLETLDVSY